MEVARGFRDADPPWTSDELAERLRLPVRNVREVLDGLRQARIVTVLDDSVEPGGLQLARPAERIALLDVLEALRGRRELMAGEPGGTGAVETLLRELGEGEAKAACGRSLADVLAHLASAPPRIGRS